MTTLPKVPLLLLSGFAWLAAGQVLGAQAASPADAPLAPFPVAGPMPVGDSVLPFFVDDDELVRVSLRRDGAVATMVDDLKLKINGGGDYAMTLPGPVLSVADQGGDSVPGLSNGKVRFLGRLDVFQKLLAAEAVLDPNTYAANLPVQVTIGYQDRHASGSGRRTYTETVDIANMTGQPAQFLRGTPDSTQLAQVLDALRGVPAVYTPETNLAALYPQPPSLRLQPPVATQVAQSFVPLSIDVKVHLESGSTMVSADGAEVLVDSRGTTLHWLTRLPRDTTSDGRLKLTIVFTGAAPLRVPAVDIKAQVLPLPASVFSPPKGGGWAQALRSAANTGDLAVLAQAGALSLHRIGDLSPPVGRPGGGPERVAFELVLNSGKAVPAKAPLEPPLRAEAWAVALASLIALAVATNAYLAWSRH